MGGSSHGFPVTKCQSLPPAKGNYLLDDYIENLMLTVLDYQMRSVTIVRAIGHYRNQVRDGVRSHQQLKYLLSSYPDTPEGNHQVAQYLWGYNLWSRVALLRRLLGFF